jgi:hypothetical protein
MKRLLIGLVLSVMATAAQAQWVLVAGNDEDKIYADPATKSRSGNVVRVWVLYDRAKSGTVGGKAYSSGRFYDQYDCAEKTAQQLQGNVFTGNMLTGSPVDADIKPTDKEFVAPGSIAEALLNFACK